MNPTDEELQIMGEQLGKRETAEGSMMVAEDNSNMTKVLSGTTVVTELATEEVPLSQKELNRIKANFICY